MKLHTSRHIAFGAAVFFLAMLTFLSADARKKKVVKTSVPTVGLSYNDSLRFNYFFIEASRQQNAGHYDAAFDLLRHCLEINPSSASTYFLLSNYQAELKNNDLALSYMKKAVELNPDNTTYLERLGQHYIGLKEYYPAILVYQKLSKLQRERTDILNVLVQLYNQWGRFSDMLKTFDRIEQIEGNSENLTLSRMAVYEGIGNTKAAYKSLKKLCDEHPSDVNYRVMMGNWLMQHNKQDEAYRIFQDALKEEPDNSYAQTSLYDYYNAVGHDSLSTMLRKMVVNPKTESKTRMSMLQQMIRQNEQQGGDSTEVIAMLHEVLKANPKDAATAELEAVYKSLKKFPQDSVNAALARVLDIAPDNAGVRVQLLQNEWAKKDWNKIVEISKPGIEYNPDEMAFYYFLGLAYFQQDKQDLSLDAFRRGVSQITRESNKDIVSDFYAIMGDILHQKGMNKEAFAAYDSCLQWKANNIECLNNYAYYLSEEKRDLKRAEEMSYRTIKAEPKSTTFLDTYAWILFLEERYAEAKIYIDQAIANDTDSVVSAVILEHAGDIYAVLGQTKEALDYWQRALKAGSENALLQKKIKLKKYIE